VNELYLYDMCHETDTCIVNEIA